MSQTFSAPCRFINVSPPARKRARRATLSIRKTNAEARSDGPKFATRRHNRTCCLCSNKGDRSSPKGGTATAGAISRRRRWAKPRMRAGSRAPLYIPELRDPKSNTTVKTSILSPTIRPPLGKGEHSRGKKDRANFPE